MKKLRMLSILLFFASTIIFVSYKVYEKVNEDTTPPVISFQGEEITISVTDDESVLLNGVKAEDNRDGDISDRLIVERKSAFTEENVRTITYAVMDDNGNVAKKERTLCYSDYTAPQFSMTDDLRFPMKSSISVLSNISAESVLDGDLSNVIKYSLESSMLTTETGTYPVEFRVMDSVGKTVYLNTEIEIYDGSKETISVYLSEYLVYAKAGMSFDAGSYYTGASREGVLSIDSDVDMSNPGVYHVDYTIVDGSAYGTSRLLVVVEP